MANNKKVFKSAIVTYTAKNSKERSLEDYYGFGVYRIRFTDKGRTAYVTVPVCEENRKKLTDVYGENIFNGNYNSIILIIGSIFCDANHTEYSEFRDIVDNNYSYINGIIDLFANPKANIEDLRNIIEDSAKECKKISSNYGRGGK